jgi:2-keto-4-pentenoate hydratase
MGAGLDGRTKVSRSALRLSISILEPMFDVATTRLLKSRVSPVATVKRPALKDLQKPPSFEIDLRRDGTVVDHGRATNVLGGPVSALRHLVDIPARDQVNPPLAAGEIVTTGTLTRALPVSASETWTTELTGVALDGICVRLA